MNATDYLALANALLTGIETLAPKIAELTAAGEISVDAQKALATRISSIEDGSAFLDPAWKPGA